MDPILAQTLFPAERVARHVAVPQEFLEALAATGGDLCDAGNIVDLTLRESSDGEALSVETRLAAE